MDQLRKTFCRYDMVCDNPVGVGLELYHMPEFFVQKHGMETDKVHVHGFFEIIWFEQGEGVHYVDFNEYPVAPNTVFFISPGQIHSFDQRHDQKGVVLKICSELLTDESSSDSSFLRYNVFNAFDHMPYSRLTECDAQKLSSIVRALEDEMNEQEGVGHKEYLQALIKMLIIRVQRSQPVDNSPILNPTRNSHKNFLAFRQLLEANFTRLHTVKDYASLLHVTSKTLTQYVNECSTYSPLELINNRITLEAKRLLRYSNLTVKEISFRLGFDDPSYFVKFFKRQVHTSPAEYRHEQN